MVSKKSSSRLVPTLASTATPSHSTNKSSISRSAFSPSRFQLALFASVVQGLDSQYLRVHDVLTGRLKCEHAIDSSATIACLDWGLYGINGGSSLQEQLKRKRKRSHVVNGAEEAPGSANAVVAFGTSHSKIHMFSPAESKTVGVLEGGHTRGIRGFKFINDGESGEGWSLGGDGKLVQWDLLKGTSSRVVKLPTDTMNALLPTASFVICASNQAYIIDPIDPRQTHPMQASTNLVHTIVASSGHQPSAFLTSADSDRPMHVFDAKEGKIIGSLVAEDEVLSIAYHSGPSSKNGVYPVPSGDVLAVTTKGASVEIFVAPFEFQPPQPHKTITSLKPKRNAVRKAAASVKMKNLRKGGAHGSILSASFHLNEIVMAYTEGGVDLAFERVKWRNEETGDLAFTGTKEVIKNRSDPIVGATVMNGVKDVGQSQVDESKTVVVNGGGAEYIPAEANTQEVIDISSGDDDSNEDMVSEPASPEKALGDEIVTGDADMVDAEPDETDEPSFGDLIRASAPEIVDVAETTPDLVKGALVHADEKSLKLPSGMSLGTVLTQSLRTNDVNLLETCLHVRDLDMVRATIERLDSSLATALLRKLAERLHSRPGRAGSLMVWIQWTLIAHGGYLASQADVVKQLASLDRVVKERANSLQPLLSLKGKLDMLEAQLNLRRNMQLQSRNLERSGDDDEENLIYVEGQEDSTSEDEARPKINSEKPHLLTDKSRGASTRREQNIASSSEDEEDDDDDMPTTMEAMIHESSDEASGSNSGDLIDDEASEADEESTGEDSVDHEDVDSVDEDEESEPESPPKKRSSRPNLSNGAFSKRT